MKWLSSFLFASVIVVKVVFAGSAPSGCSVVHAPRKGHYTPDRFGNAPAEFRDSVYIRASANDTDDISAEFLWGLKEANKGGQLVLEKGKTYIIGRKLDLTFLQDVYVRLDGEIKVLVPFCDLQMDFYKEIPIANLSYSSQTISNTGKLTTSTTPSRKVLHSGSGAERTSSFTALVR